MSNFNQDTPRSLMAKSKPQYEKPSKSQLKRDMIALQKIGQQLVEASVERVKRIDLPENLKIAIDECRKIKSREGRRRQLQFIGKIMRNLDQNDLDAINKAIDSWQGQSKAEIAAMHAIEKQREKLIETDSALTEFLENYPQIDAPHLRNLIRNARKEQAEGKPPKAYREIYQVIKQAKNDKHITDITNITDQEE